jgi:hypothetical protein
MIIDDGQHQGRGPGAGAGEHLARAVMKVQMPQYAPRRILWLMPCPGLCGAKDSDAATIKNFARPYST